MALYANVNGAQKNLMSMYSNVNGVLTPMNEMHANINGVKKQIFSRTYRWAKYQSYCYKADYSDYGSLEDETNVIPIYPRSDIIDTGWLDGIVVNRMDGTGRYDLWYGDSFDYSKSTGRFTLNNRRNAEIGGDISYSNYGIEATFIGKYVLSGNNMVYKITDHEDVYKLICGIYYFPGSKWYRYTWKYIEDVTSTDPNAYTTGTKSDYISSEPDDIRTVYIKK